MSTTSKSIPKSCRQNKPKQATGSKQPERNSTSRNLKPQKRGTFLSERSSNGSKVKTSPEASPCAPSNRSSKKPGSEPDLVSVTFSRKSSARLRELCGLGEIDITEFATGHVDCFLDQIYDGREFGEQIAASHVYDSVDEAARVGKAANAFDKRHRDWAIIRTKNGRFSLQRDLGFIADELKRGGLIVAHVSPFGTLNLEVAA